MALTIRSLSETAENALLNIQENNEHINTSSKAIEFVLENYPTICDDLDYERKEKIRYKRELLEAQDKLENIAKGFELITKMIAKKD